MVCGAMEAKGPRGEFGTGRKPRRGGGVGEDDFMGSFIGRRGAAGTNRVPGADRTYSGSGSRIQIT